jgi:CubicO group peptidase (beta-lactamase class C family)
MNDLKFAVSQLLKKSPFAVVTVLTLALAIAASTSAGTVESGNRRKEVAEWTTALPEEAGFDSAALSEMCDYVREHRVPVHSVQIARHGKLVFDAYFYPYNSDMRHDAASVTKSVTSTLIGLAIQKGLIHDVHQSVLTFFPNRSVANSDSNKQKLTIEHLLTMQAGWDCGFEPRERGSLRCAAARTGSHSCSIYRWSQSQGHASLTAAEILTCSR